MDAFIARQPIFDKNKNIFAYELLFRDGMDNFMPDIAGDTASSSLLSSSFFTIGLEKITGGKKAFINFTQNLILQKTPLMFPPDLAVVEILETVTPDENTIQAVKDIAAKKYTIALDDFVFSKQYLPLVNIADIIKIDFRITPHDQIKKYINLLSPLKVEFLAEKIETHEEFSQALEMGFAYFQGYFFCKPEIVKGKDISSNRINLLNITSTLNRDDFKFDELENLMEREVGITYKLLRYINSAFFNFPKEITSLKQALIMMGADEIRRFMSLIIMSRVCTGKPQELLKTSCQRARFFELLGNEADPSQSRELFTLGLFSLLDAILDQPMKVIMEKLPLSRGIQDALVEKKGVFADYVKLAETYEKARWHDLSETASKIMLNEEAIPSLYMDACEWAEKLPL